MKKKIFIIALAVFILTGIGSCGSQEGKIQDGESVESDLKKINEAIEQFSMLKNGTLETTFHFESENHAVESLNTEITLQNSLTTFVLQESGYDFLEETTAFNESTKEYRYSAVKQVNGFMYFSEMITSTSTERPKAYVWGEAREPNGTGYELNGTLTSMAVPSKLINNRKYIGSIARETDGLLIKYTVTTNNDYAKYLKEVTHGVQENYIVHEHRTIYWVNESGLLVKQQSYDESEWTIDGKADTYVTEMTVELTGYDLQTLDLLQNLHAISKL